MSDESRAMKADLPVGSQKRPMKTRFSPPSVRQRKDKAKTGVAKVEESEKRLESFNTNCCDPSMKMTSKDKQKSDGVALNARILAGRDSEAFDNIMQKQIEIVEGTEQFYLRIDTSLKEGNVEPFFVKEQWDLYAWREKFFNDNFPEGSWFTDPDIHEPVSAVIPLQITRNFTEIMEMASSTEERKEEEKHYFEHDDLISFKANNIFSRTTIKHQLEEKKESLKSWIEREDTLTFPQIAHMIVEFHQDGLSLVFGCEEKKECDKLKEMMKQGKNEDDISSDLKTKATVGWYDASDQPPKFLTGEGKKIFNDVRAIFKEKDSQTK